VRSSTFAKLFRGVSRKPLTFEYRKTFRVAVVAGKIDDFVLVYVHHSWALWRISVDVHLFITTTTLFIFIHAVEVVLTSQGSHRRVSIKHVFLGYMDF
jgi:hypothetical protein